MSCVKSNAASTVKNYFSGYDNGYFQYFTAQPVHSNRGVSQPATLYKKEVTFRPEKAIKPACTTNLQFHPEDLCAVLRP